MATVTAVSLVAWSFAAITWRGGTPASAATRPNIVFVIADDMRDDQLAGMPIVGAELVGVGVTFPNAFASRPLCCPSRVSILRGQYAHTTGIYTNTAPSGGYKAFRDRGLESSTLATWLDAAGYRTGLFGKYLNEYGPGNTVVPPGWDRWVAIDETNAAYTNYDLNIDGTITHFGTTAVDYSTDVLSRYADAFVRDTPADTPLFAYLSYSAPHEPYRPSTAYANDPRCANATTTNRPSFNEADVSDKPSEIRNISPLSSADQTLFGTILPQKQCRALLSVDDGVGQILDALADTGRLSDTLIVFVSDNGLFLGEHRLPDSKGKTYEEAVNIPFVVRYDAIPGIGGTVDDRIVANIDLAPMATDAAGLSITPGCPTPPYGSCNGAFDGRSLLPLLNGTASGWRSGILLESPNWCGIRTARYNFTRYGSGFEELYDLQADPYQLDNALFGQITPQEQALRDSLLSDLRTLCSPTPPSFSFGSSSPPTISSFTPTSGAPGTGVAITGTGFSGATAVRFGSASALFTVGSSTTITATVPSGAVSGPISVQTPNGTATSAGTFTVLGGGGGGPIITGFTPAAGPVGTTVTISGSGFAGATAVAFNGAAAVYTVNGSNQIIATVPAGATSGQISVTTPGGSATSSSSFAVSSTTVLIRVIDDAFSPAQATVPQGSTAVWTFEGAHAHAVTDTSLIGPGMTPLFDSGRRTTGASFSYTFVAAAQYEYRSNQGEAQAMIGVVRVPIVASPSSGSVSAAFTVTWASATISGCTFEVQTRFRAAGASTFDAWSPYVGPTTNLSAPFTASRGAGKYQFRARVRNTSTGRTTKWSAVTGVSVS